MKRLLLPLVLLAAIVPASSAAAHPLGNFSVNRLSEVRVSSDGVEVHWILDQAEIPTFQERGEAPAEVLARKRAEARRGLALTVDGHSVALRGVGAGSIAFPPGQGGLRTTRVELRLRAPVQVHAAVVLRDGTFPGRVGWHAVVVRPGSGTDVRSDVPAEDPTGGLRRYPLGAIDRPRDDRVARFAVRPGDGVVTAPRASGLGTSTVHGGQGDGLAGVFAHAASGRGVIVLLLLAAFGWGALHALSPGHGKAMVAAYLVGTRGRPHHAVALGAIVTVTHTAGVFALGLVTLALSQYVLPEDIYPWLTLVSGLLVVGVGAAVLRSRFRTARAHHHHHHGSRELSARGLVAMGASAGLIPCPSALVVLLGAIAQHQLVLGLVLIVAFSFGLATTLTGLGLAVVYAGRVAGRFEGSARLASVVSAASALAIVAVGCVLTIKAVPGVIG